MKVLFISKELHKTAGSGVGARMHLDSIKEAIGEENVYLIDLDVDIKPEKKAQYISYGKYPSKIDRIIRHIEGNTYYFSNRIICEIVECVKTNGIDVVFIDDSYFGKLAKAIKNQCPDVRVLAFFHDVKAELFKIWMKRANLINKWDYKNAIRNEYISVGVVDANIVLNSEEDELLRKYYEKEADYYLPVCVEKSFEIVADDPYTTENKKHILFVGTSYLPNLNAVRWFSSKVVPQVRDKYDLWVVGKGLECLREEISDSDVHIVGFADSIHPFYSKADIVIAPLVDGGGMKIKTAEAFSYGKVFMGSSESLHGYYSNIPDALKNKIVFCCDSADDYITNLNMLASGEINKENKELVDVYDMYYSHQAAVNKMKEILFDR